MRSAREVFPDEILSACKAFYFLREACYWSDEWCDALGACGAIFGENLQLSFGGVFPLSSGRSCVRNDGWNVVKEAGENQSDVGWDQARRVNQSRPVGRAPTTPVRPLETGRIRGGGERLVSIRTSMLHDS
jgi:hypothetical protein